MSCFSHTTNSQNGLGRFGRHWKGNWVRAASIFHHARTTIAGRYRYVCYIEHLVCVCVCVCRISGEYVVFAIYIYNVRETCLVLSFATTTFEWRAFLLATTWGAHISIVSQPPENQSWGFGKEGDGSWSRVWRGDFGKSYIDSDRFLSSHPHSTRVQPLHRIHSHPIPSQSDVKAYSRSRCCQMGEPNMRPQSLCRAVYLLHSCTTNNRGVIYETILWSTPDGWINL